MRNGLNEPRDDFIGTRVRTSVPRKCDPNTQFICDLRFQKIRALRAGRRSKSGIFEDEKVVGRRKVSGVKPCRVDS